MKCNLTIYYMFVFVSVILSCAQAHASFCEKKTYVFYGNGMFNDQEYATKNYKALERELRKVQELPEDQWIFDVSYNHDEKLFSIFQVFRQREGERASTFWRWISGLSIAPDWFREKALELASHSDLAMAVRDADLRRHIQRYKTVLMEGGRVLVVGHSQGNLYANAAHTNLAHDPDNLPMDAFGLVAVATPSGRVAGGGPHVTLTNDLVINSVRLFYPDTLDGNVTNGNDGDDWKHHSFIDAYLDGDRSGPLVVNNALSVANGLAWPTPMVGTGPITVTLSWGNQPDVDLHIYEPDGSHVYYANLRGTSGYLDVDDVSAFGPEHYYVVNCNDLAAGTYRVGVNYYYGSAPETASVMIQAGDVIRDYSINLPQEEGRSGDSNPEPVANIEVVGDPENGYDFTVQGQ